MNNIISKVSREIKCVECKSEIDRHTVEIIGEKETETIQKNFWEFMTIYTGKFTLTVKYHCHSCGDRQYIQEFNNNEQK